MNHVGTTLRARLPPSSTIPNSPVPRITPSSYPSIPPRPQTFWPWRSSSTRHRALAESFPLALAATWVVVVSAVVEAYQSTARISVVRMIWRSGSDAVSGFEGNWRLLRQTWGWSEVDERGSDRRWMPKPRLCALSELGSGCTSSSVCQDGEPIDDVRPWDHAPTHAA